MKKIFNTIFGFFLPKVIYKTKSNINGEIRVIELLGKRSINVGGLQQSGEMVEMLWEKGIAEIEKGKRKKENLITQVYKCLILGLGGGSVVKVINQYFPNAQIIGIEIDPKIIQIAKQYFNLGQYKNLEVQVSDAFSYVKNTEKKFDLVLVDLYLGNRIPPQALSEQFLQTVKKRLKSNGTMIINRLRNNNNKKELDAFSQKLKKYFFNVEKVNPLINTLFIAHQQ